MAALLKSQRAYVKGRLTYFSNLLNDGQKHITTFQLQAIQNNMCHLFTKFDVLQLKIEEIEIEELEKGERKKFDDHYCELESLILAKLDANKEKSTNKTEEVLPLGVKCRLPEMELPKFDGNYSSWLTFKDEYEGLVHYNESLDDMSRFRYLISAVRDGSAYSIIEYLQRTKANYGVAWKLLKDSFDNETLIKKMYIRDIYNINPVRENCAVSLQQFIDSFLKYFNALKALEVDVQTWDLFIIHHLTQKLDLKSKRQVEKESSADEIMSVDAFIGILKKRCRLMNAITESNAKPSAMRTKSNRHDKTSRTLVATTSLKCTGCLQGSHMIYQCENFLKLTPEARFDLVKQRKLCLNCLSVNHTWQKCNSKFNCRECGKRHHLLLHRFGPKSNVEVKSVPIPSSSGAQNVTKECNSSSTMHTTQKSPSSDCLSICYESSGSGTSLASTALERRCNSSRHEKKTKQVVIATAIIWVYDNAGFRLPCRAVLDSASHAHFITEDFCQKLNVNKKSGTSLFSGIGNVNTKSRCMVTLSIASRFSEFSTELDFLVLSSITNELPVRDFDFNMTDLPPAFELADPFFNKRDKVDMLIGTEVYHEIITGERIKLCDELPPFQVSKFGYIFAGSVTESFTDNKLCSLLTTLDDLNANIQKFWLVETLTSPTTLSIEERECEKHYCNGVSREENGRYVVSLPLRSNITELGESRSSAKQQFFRLEQRLLKNEELRCRYNQFMKEYEDLNHMEEVIENHSVKSEREFYVPHHCVLKSSNGESKLRVVFNASFKTSSNVSLNDALMVGPTIQKDVFSILARFRKHKFAFSADIVKMYRQVKVRKEDRDLQRIWWRYKPDEPLKVFRLKTVTYGTASAPFLAIRTLSQLSIDESEEFPNAANVLKSDFYVDDVASGADTEEDAIALRYDLISLLRRGCFELDKFSSNFKIPTECPLHQPENDNVKSILGIQWDTQNDCFIIKLGIFSSTHNFTKRAVLSEITQIFDPLGLCSPVIFYAKYFMQKLWAEADLSWDDTLPEVLQDEWVKIRNDLVTYNSVRIPRCVIPVNANYIVLHGFGDASERGYGCCLYVSVRDALGVNNTQILCAKSRVAPLRKLTIPRLELCASLLLSQLVSKVVACMDVKFDAIYFWTDSEITLFRIKSSPSRFATFVGNRIAQIQEVSHPDNWFYVPTEQNPADIVSRGVMASAIQNKSMWWNGPQFLNEENQFWPKQPINSKDRKDDEHRKNEVVLLQRSQSETECDVIFVKYSNFSTLLRTVALCYRFIQNCRNKISSTPVITTELTPVEIESALLCLVKVVQQQAFKTEILSLKSQKPISKSNKLIKLAPFLDDNDLLRVGGRIHHSMLSYNHKHQMLLPKDHPFTQLMVNYEHNKNLHVGPQALLNIIRRRFWIVNGRDVCRKVVHSCVLCFKTRPILFQQIMGQLPPERVQPSRPFLTVGIDFCGPFYSSYKIRSKVTSKVYVAVFICFCTKAVHLEVVHDLTTATFIAAFRRFTGRRGNPSRVYSDNATNFVGAQSELKELQQIFDQQLENRDLTRYCTSQGILWQTIPPRSPHFGGLWEAAVKSAKYHLKRVIATHKFTSEELETIVVQVESNLNSRPISPMSNDPNDLNVLTPGHFLIGDTLIAPPDPNLLDLNFDRLSRWQRVQHTLQQFWKKWSREYLNELQFRGKWHIPSSIITVGCMVIIKDDNLPPMKWMLGRIIKTYVGEDNLIRVVDIKTSTNVVKRAVTRICVLPFEGNQG